MFLKNLFKKYWKDTSGVSAIVFGLSLPALLAAGGLAVDLAKAYNVKNRLGNSLDKAALAAASSTGDEAALEARMQAFFDANFPAEKLGTPLNVDLSLNNNVISISASARVDTSFMRIFGKDYVDVTAFTEVVRELSGIEVALVLDVTGSMAGSNIIALRQASNDFIDIMFDRITDEDFIKIGIVPYSSSVNVGPYGLGLDLLGAAYDTPFITQPASDPFVNPATLTYNPNSYYQWHGCVLARSYPLDTQDGPPNQWGMYRYQYYNPNRYCPDEPLVPLTNNEETLHDTIDGLNASGWTYGNYGMVWGWRVLSPDYPFTEGVPYDNEEWEKAVLMMTDGRNTMHSYYSTYGLTNSHNIDPSDLNDRFAEICQSMKDEGITIYTVTFQSGVNASTRQYYEDCASDVSKYFHAPSNDELVDVFQNIANQLSQLHISQ